MLQTQRLSRWYDRAIRLENDYHESIESYKGISWANFMKKLKKKKEVRELKRSKRQSNQALRELNEVRGCYRTKRVADNHEVDELGIRHILNFCDFRFSAWIEPRC
jgi:hypothetical protein